jgi:hypothetical protein
MQSTFFLSEKEKMLEAMRLEVRQLIEKEHGQGDKAVSNDQLIDMMRTSGSKKREKEVARPTDRPNELAEKVDEVTLSDFEERKGNHIMAQLMNEPLDHLATTQRCDGDPMQDFKLINFMDE